MQNNCCSTQTKTGAAATTEKQETARQYVTPLANVTETAEGYVIEAEMPGVRPDGLDITVENGKLVIVGKRHVRESAGRPIYSESRSANYRRAFELDSSIDTAKVAASINQGVLRLQLPKAESVKPCKIEVN